MTELLYVDTSVVMGLVFREPGWEVLADRVEQVSTGRVTAVSSALLLIEMRRVLFRVGRPWGDTDSVTTWINVLDLDHDVLMVAGDFAVHLGTLDAMHLAVARSLQSPTTKVTVWSLDNQMNRAAAQLGLL